MVIATYQIPEEYRKGHPKSSGDITEGEGRSPPDREETGKLGMIGKGKAFAGSGVSEMRVERGLE